VLEFALHPQIPKIPRLVRGRERVRRHRAAEIIAEL
jgi:hypothetical protein